MSTPASNSTPATPANATPAVPPSTPDASFAPQLPPPQELGKLNLTPSNHAAPVPPPKNVLRRSFSSHPAYKRAREAANNAANSARRQAAKLRAHPAAVRTGDMCAKQAQSAREILGRSDAVVEAERITGVDRLFLVVAASLLFLALVPANLLGLAAPVTTVIVSVRPTYHTLNALMDGEEDVKHLLTFYVALGLFQCFEGMVPSWLLDAIPRYYMCKLIVLTYLGHPRFKGSSKLYDWKQQATGVETPERKLSAGKTKEARQTPTSPEPSTPASPFLGQPSPCGGQPSPLGSQPDLFDRSGYQSPPIQAYEVIHESHTQYYLTELRVAESDSVSSSSAEAWAQSSGIARPGMYSDIAP